jgi:hypothetical protein
MQHVRNNRVGQNHIYIGLAKTIYIRCTNGIFGREIAKNYGHIRCICTVLATPTYIRCLRYFWQEHHAYVNNPTAIGIHVNNPTLISIYVNNLTAIGIYVNNPTLISIYVNNLTATGIYVNPTFLSILYCAWLFCE